MMYRALSLAAATASCLLLASPASAATVMFQGLGLFTASAPSNTYVAPNKSFTFSFNLENPVPESGAIGGTVYTMAATNFLYSLDGVAKSVDLRRIGFTDTGFTFEFADELTMTFSGADIFHNGAASNDGTVMVPSWGSYSVYVSMPSSGPGPASRAAPVSVGTAMVVTTTAAVPEPATWGLMLLGFGGIGAVLRRRTGLAMIAA